MKFHYCNLETCHEAMGLVVVVDVIRAFTNAAFVFSRGAKEIHPVSGVEEALLLKAQTPNALACGEVGGIAPQGFDFGNSPTQTNELDLTGKTIIQRTGAGTQGIVRCRNAETLLAASFVVAGPTARYIRSLETDRVTFVITGETFSGGEEDFACAEYLQALLSGIKPDPLPFIQRVHNSRDAILHLDPNQTTFPRSDLDLCSHIDAFDFAMLVTRENGRHIMRTVNP